MFLYESIIELNCWFLNSQFCKNEPGQFEEIWESGKRQQRASENKIVYPEHLG